MSLIKRVQGDTQPLVNLILKDRNTGDEYDSSTWDVLDLSGLTILLAMRKKGTTTLIDTVTGSFITDGTDGNVAFELSNTIVDTAEGLYEAEIIIDHGAGSTHTVYEVLDFSFRKDF